MAISSMMKSCVPAAECFTWIALVGAHFWFESSSVHYTLCSWHVWVFRCSDSAVFPLLNTTTHKLSSLLFTYSIDPTSNHPQTRPCSLSLPFVCAMGFCAIRSDLLDICCCSIACGRIHTRTHTHSYREPLALPEFLQRRVETFMLSNYSVMSSCVQSSHLGRPTWSSAESCRIRMAVILKV